LLWERGMSERQFAVSGDWALGADSLQWILYRRSWAVYRSNQLPLTTRMRAAIAALPFESPKLAVTAMVSEQDFATVLDRRLKRIEEMRAKVIEAKPAQIEAKSNPMPRIADKRYRRM